MGYFRKQNIGNKIPILSGADQDILNSESRPIEVSLGMASIKQLLAGGGGVEGVTEISTPIVGEGDMQT